MPSFKEDWVLSFFVILNNLYRGHLFLMETFIFCNQFIFSLWFFINILYQPSLVFLPSAVSSLSLHCSGIFVSWKLKKRNKKNPPNFAVDGSHCSSNANLSTELSIPALSSSGRGKYFRPFPDWHFLFTVGNGAWSLQWFIIKRVSVHLVTLRELWAAFFRNTVHYCRSATKSLWWALLCLF